MSGGIGHKKMAEMERESKVENKNALGDMRHSAQHHVDLGVANAAGMFVTAKAFHIAGRDDLTIACDERKVKKMGVAPSGGVGGGGNKLQYQWAFSKKENVKNDDDNYELDMDDENYVLESRFDDHDAFFEINPDDVWQKKFKSLIFPKLPNDAS